MGEEMDAGVRIASVTPVTLYDGERQSKTRCPSECLYIQLHLNVPSRRPTLADLSYFISQPRGSSFVESANRFRKVTRSRLCWYLQNEQFISGLTIHNHRQVGMSIMAFVLKTFSTRIFILIFSVEDRARIC